MMARGPSAALTRNSQGRVVAKPQASPKAGELAEYFADTLNKGSDEGYLKVSEDFAVTLTGKGEAFARKAVEEATAGCDIVTSVGADWTGFQVQLESTCTLEEFGERTGLNLGDIGAGEISAVPASVSAAGFAPPVESRPAGDAISSEWWGCIGSFALFGVSLVGVGLAVVSPATSWFMFWLTWGVTGTGFFSAGTAMAQNCTQAVSARSHRQTWVSYETPLLPIATIGLSSFRIQDVFSPPKGGNETWITTYRSCSFSYYSNYRWSSYGYSVPLYKRFNCY